MSQRARLARRLVAVVAAFIVILSASSVASAHEQRDVSGYHLVVGMINEPVYVGIKSGLEFSVTKDDQPVTGLETTLKAEATKGGVKRDLAVGRRFGQDGWYQSFFFPTEAGPYTFRIFGTIEGATIDETFVAEQTGSGSGQFGAVSELADGQFPPLATSDGGGSGDAAGLALIVGAIGVVLGVVGIGIGLASRRRVA